MRLPHIFLFLIALVLLLSSCGGPQPPSSNRLADSASPYLRQHGQNPVDWFPWGQEALDSARAQGKLLIISIGYSACHWCHVMERESFSDTAVARIMNNHFISIKVDREERPDIDKVYIDAALEINGSAGWPLNVIALPDGRPLYTTTYLPRDRWQYLLDQFIGFWAQDSAQMARNAAILAERLANESLPEIDNLWGKGGFTPAEADSMAAVILSYMDLEKGGMKGAPKFPMPGLLTFLLDYHVLKGDSLAGQVVEHSLDRMAAGGIYDHLGGGFHRYSTDVDWKVPHFEKMLYDNAQLVELYSKAWQVWGKARYQEVVSQTMAFVRRELRDSIGGFYSSIDADVDNLEGAYYTWTEREILKLLARRDPGASKAIKDYYGVLPKGNWEDRQNILYQAAPDSMIARKYGYDSLAFRQLLAAANDQLFVNRELRLRPMTDDKIVVANNALMLQASAYAWRVFGDSTYLEMALENARLLTDAIDEKGRIPHVLRQQGDNIPGFADDYAYSARALITLYEATFDPEWLSTAEKLLATLELDFSGATEGFLYYAPEESATPVTRPLSLEDQVVPSANGVAAEAAFLLGHYLYRPGLLEKAGKWLNSARPLMRQQPPYTWQWGQLLLKQSHPFYEVAIVGTDWLNYRQAIDQQYLPQALLLGGEEPGTMELLANKKVEGKTLIYVCRDKVCKLPVEEVRPAIEQLK